MLVGGGFRLDGSADDSVGEADGFQKDRLLGIAQGVAGDGIAEADQGDDVARRRLRQLFAVFRIGEDMINLADHFLAVLTRIERPALGLEHTGIDAKVEKLAVRIGHDFEDQSAKRLFRIGLAFFFLIFFLWVDTSDGRPVQGAGQVLDDGVHERLDANVLAARAA